MQYTENSLLEPRVPDTHTHTHTHTVHTHIHAHRDLLLETKHV